MNDLLFHQYNLSSVVQNQERNMASEIDGLPESRLLNTPVDDLCNYFAEKYSIEPPEINEAGIQADYSDAKVDVSRRFEYAVFDSSQPAYVTGTKLTFYVPFDGDSNLFKCRPATFNSSPPRAEVRDGEVLMVYEQTTSEADKIETEFKRDLENLKSYLGWIKRDVTPFNAAVRDKAKQRIEARRQKLLNDRGLVEKIGFPLRRREGAPQTFAAPRVKRKIAPRLPPASTAAFTPEPALEMEEYEHILSVVSNMVLVMERSPHAFIGMNEEDLRQHFLVQLNGQYEGQATGETFNFQGKTDILIRVEGKNIFVAECKFWEGPKSLARAIEQLLGYASWRDTKTALLIFNRGGNLTSVLGRIPEAVKVHSSFKRELSHGSETGFRYILHHRDDPSRELVLTILVFEIPI